MGCNRRKVNRMRLTEWRRELIPQVRWSKREVSDLQWERYWPSSKGNNMCFECHRIWPFISTSLYKGLLGRFYRLRQLRCVRRSLDSESAATLVHAFVTSRTDYSVMNCWRAQQKSTTVQLQRLLNTAARLVSDARKFTRSLRQLMHVDLHWLDVPERVKFKLVSHNCVHRGILWTNAFGSPMWLVDGIFVMTGMVLPRHSLSS